MKSKKRAKSSASGAFGKPKTLMSTRIGVESIERIWAHLGQVWVETADGRQKTWSPQEAAKLALLCGQLATTTGFSNEECKQLLALKSVTCEAIREAMSQQADPGDSTTKAVVGAIRNSARLLMDDDEMKTRLSRFGGMFPILKEDEIRGLIQNYPGKTDSWYEGALKELEEQRLIYLDQKRRGERAQLDSSVEKQEF